jgi:AraC family transcriptional regulator
VTRYTEPDRDPELRGRTALEGLVISEIRYSPCARQPRHAHPWTSVTLVFEGSLEERVGSVEESARPLSVVMKPAGVAHANHIGDAGATTLQLSFARDFPGPEDCRRQLGWGWIHGGPVARSFLQLLADWRGGAADEAELEGRVFDVLSRLPAPTGRTPRDPPGWLRRAAEHVDDSFRAPPRVRDLAAVAGVHPVALARAHRRHFGESITDRIRGHRIRSAAHLLADTRTPLGRVAYRVGFADQSHLCRVFKAETGLTPGRFRRLARPS